MPFQNIQDLKIGPSGVRVLPCCMRNAVSTISPRVLKFCMGSEVTQILGFHKNCGPPFLPTCYIWPDKWGDFQKLPYDSETAKDLLGVGGDV